MTAAATVDGIIEGILALEGGYVNDPHDAGGETNWGITLQVARAQGFKGRMADLTRAEAARIYAAIYADRPGYTAIAIHLSLPVAKWLIETGVNMGPAIASLMLQRLLNALNRGGADYPDLRLDGECGNATRTALNSYLNQRGAEGETRLIRGLKSLQGERYVDRAEKRPANEAFLYGWLGRMA